MIDVDDMITEVQNKSQRWNPDKEDLQRSMGESANPDHDLWDVCCGHDLVCILSLGFRKALGSQTQQNVRSELIERSLRLAYETTYIFATQLYKSMRPWEGSNQPFKVFPES